VPLLLLLAATLAMGGEASDADRFAIQYEYKLDMQTPDEDVALLESVHVGFGAGHFYARQPELGAGMAAVQVVGLSMLGGSIAFRAQHPTRWENGIGAPVLLGGAGIFLLGRALDIGLAPASARRTTRAVLAQQP
jgi:hypothetical protein